MYENLNNAIDATELGFPPFDGDPIRGAGKGVELSLRARRRMSLQFRRRSKKLPAQDNALSIQWQRNICAAFEQGECHAHN